MREGESPEPSALRLLYQARAREQSPLVRAVLERVIGKVEQVAKQREQRRRGGQLFGLIWLPGLPPIVEFTKRLVSGDVEWRQAVIPPRSTTPLWRASASCPASVAGLGRLEL